MRFESFDHTAAREFVYPKAIASQYSGTAGITQISSSELLLSAAGIIVDAVVSFVSSIINYNRHFL